MHIEMAGTYNLGLATLSFAISVIASYTALDLAGRVQSAVKRGRLLWLLGGAAAMGTGIWSMHFIAMLAFQLPQSVSYDMWITLFSLMCAVLASSIALWLLSRSVSIHLLTGGGVCMGIAIAWMHYTGMAAMQLSARIEYDWRLVSLSVVIAITASFAALWLAFRLQHQSIEGLIWQKCGSAFVMGLAISGMHYTGMMATHFIPYSLLPVQQSPAMNQSWLAIAIGIATLFILSLALITSLFDRRLTAHLIRQKALLESEKRFRMLIREMPVGVLLLNVNAEILICNQVATNLLNLKPPQDLPHQVFGEDWLFLHEDGTPFRTLELPVQQAIALRQPIHNTVMGIQKKVETGRINDQKSSTFIVYPSSPFLQKWLLVNADPQIAEDGSVERIVCTLSDITNHKQAEAALRQSEERFALAVEGVNDGIWDWNIPSDYAYLSPRWKSMLGYEDSEIPNHIDSFKKVIHPEDSERVLAVLIAYLAKKIPNYEVEFRALHKDGSYRWILTRGVALWDSSGVSYRVAGSHTDITERKQREAALQLIAEGTASATGHEFFRACVHYLAQVLEVRYALVTQVANDSKTKVRTLAFWKGEDFGENFEYELAGTPCKNVVEGIVHFYPSGVQELFPNDRDLAQLGAQSYWGIPLLDSAGKTIGSLVVLDVEPIVQNPGKEMILQIFVARAGAELERKLAEDLLKKRAEMDSLLSRISRIFIDENLDTAITFTLQAVGEFLGSDHTYLFRYCDNQHYLMMTHEWCDKGIEPLIDKFQLWPVEIDVWGHSQLLMGKTVQIPAEFSLTDTEVADQELISFQSRLAVPTLYSAKVVGFMGLDAVHSSKLWSQEEINWLRLVNEFIAISQARQEAQAALQQSNSRYQNLAQNVPGMIYQFILYPDGSRAFLYASAGCRELFGIEPEAVVEDANMSWKLTHPDDIAIVNQSIATSAKTLKPWDCIWRVFVAGELKWLRGNSRPDPQPDGSIIWDGLVTDITEHKQAELALQESAEREKAIAFVIQRMRQTLEIETIFSATTQELRQALNCERVAVYRFNPDWSGEFVSESLAAGWKALVEEQKQEFELNKVAVNQVDCIVPTLGTEDSTVHDTYLQETAGGIYKQGRSYTCVPNVYEAGFDQCYLELLERFQARAYIIVPIFCSNQLWGLLATYQNSGPRHWQSAEIKMVVQIGAQLGVAIQQAHLLAQTQQQSVELMKAKVAADSANRAKSEFLANMSHELRTPLNAILGFTQLMNRDSSLNTEHRQSVGIISRSGEHLLELINDVLEMSKIEAGRTTLHENEFDLYRLLNNLFELLQIKAKDKGLKLSFEHAQSVPQFIKTDESKLRQVLINLLGNAIKFTQKGRVTLRVEVGEFTAGKGMQLRFEVSDTGVGIDPMEFDKLFEAFGQTTSGLKSGAGTGLGLPISQKFVQLMGGNLSLSSTVGEGSVFEFDIQVVPVLSCELNSIGPANEKIVGLAPDQPTYRLLIVEDKPTNRLFLFKMLTSLGFEVKEAENGEQGITLWQSWQPHLIWMDIQMPVMDGYEATKRIKATALGQSTVIIALTASAFEEDRQVILDAGCDDFVRKPFREQEMLLKISQHLGVRYLYQTPANDQFRAGFAPEECPISPRLEPSALQVMPAHWVQQLYHAASQGSDLLMLQLIEQIPPEYSSLAIALTDLVENFRFDKVRELSQPALG
ncbi:MHYT domain-containing protein [Microcoleus sp. FACHB-68]|uniref:MHYT domain-containing protein n=1 Tax=Microcoleus sp. FACHB-68 TaxID=2692826 RepID=UPI00168689F9|nr:MHYT domain-containing protein [Microcoleus sp. FACHB-68]MBD1937507.1 PAS domain-containing protein [Microcoleus sp. FACHB-68]